MQIGDKVKVIKIWDGSFKVGDKGVIKSLAKGLNNQKIFVVKFSKYEYNLYVPMECLVLENKGHLLTSVFK